MDLGISGVGFSGYSMGGYSPAQNTTASGAISLPNSNGTAASETVQATAGAAGVAGTNQAGSVTGGSADAGRVNGTADTKALKRISPAECQTCKNRTYQDGSNDPGVSFKAPGHIDPASSGAVVMAHEQEHVVNEQAKAASTDRRVVSQSVRIFTSICTECGRAYASGGETRTVTAAVSSQKQTASYKASGNSTGERFNMAV